MKKETYIKKLEATVITDDNTVGEAKTAKKVETELKRFWKQKAVEYVRNNEPESARYFNNPGVQVDVDFNLKPTGTVKVIFSNTDRPVRYPYHQEMKRYTVHKRDLFS